MATSFKRSPCIHCSTQCPLPCSSPPPTHTSAGDSWTLIGKSRSVSCGVTAPFSWVLVHSRFCLCLQESVSTVLSMSWWLYSGVNCGLLQEGLGHTQVCCTQSPCPCGRPLLTRTSAGDTQIFKGRSGSVSAASPGMHNILFEPSECLWLGMGFDSKCDFTPPTILLGLLLCPWTWKSFFWWDSTFSC